MHNASVSFRKSSMYINDAAIDMKTVFSLAIPNARLASTKFRLESPLFFCIKELSLSKQMFADSTDRVTIVKYS